MNSVLLKLIKATIDWDVISSEYTCVAVNTRTREPCHARKIEETGNEYVVYYFNRSEPVKRQLHSDSLTILAERPKAEEEPKTAVPDWKTAPADATHWIESHIGNSFRRLEGNFYYNMDGSGTYLLGSYSELKVTKRPTPKPKTEWDGTGIPPVGTVCDLVLRSVEQHRITVVAKGEVWAVVKPVDGGEEFAVSNEGWTFRKIKTDKQKAVEKMLKELNGKNLDVPRICETLYDAGYRLTEDPKWG